MRPVSAVLIGVVMIFAGCGSSSDDKSSFAPTVQPIPAATSPSSAASELDGTWRTDRITVDDMVRTLREHDLAEWVGPFRTNSPVSKTPTALILEISEGGWDLYGDPRGGARVEIDYDAQFEVDGNTVVVSHEGDSNTYRWSVRGKDLTLAWQKTTYQPTTGVPEEVFQRALYMTAKFHRTG